VIFPILQSAEHGRENVEPTKMKILPENQPLGFDNDVQRLFKLHVRTDPAP